MGTRAYIGAWRHLRLATSVIKLAVCTRRRMTAGGQIPATACIAGVAGDR